MKQLYKKKPEFLEVVKVDHDLTSVNDVIEMSEQPNVVVGFVDGKLTIDIAPDIKIKEGQVLFKDKKGVLVILDEDKLLQYYDLQLGQETKLLEE